MANYRRTAYFCIPVVVVLAGLTGCNKAGEQTVALNQAPDPANGNLAQVGDPSQQPTSAQAPLQTGYPRPPSPLAASNASYSDQAGYDQNGYGQAGYYDDASYGPPIQVRNAPPPLLEYEQPPLPGENYIWTPGYWSYDQGDYYWVPGAWVIAPYVGALWTPPYWDYSNNYYRWHRGYWGIHIGFYGGINYGFGYTGRGYYGGYWDSGSLRYNRAVTNININIGRNVYDSPVTSGSNNRFSYNGGRGVNARPTAPELAALREQRMPPVAAQLQHERQAASNRAQFASSNGGRPAVIAAPRPLATDYRVPAARAQFGNGRAESRQPQPMQQQAQPGRMEQMQQGRAVGNPHVAQEMRPTPQQATPQRSPVENGRQFGNGRNDAPGQQGRQRPEPVQAAPVQPIPQMRQTPPPQPAPQARPEQQRGNRPEQMARPAPQAQPAARPVPQQRQAPEQQRGNRPDQVARPAPQAERPQPQAQPAARPQQQRQEQRQAEAKPAQAPAAPQQRRENKRDDKGDGKK